MLLQRQKVLVVEDDPLQRLSLADLVTMEGMEVIECENAESATRALDQFAMEIEMLITDVNLGAGMSGTALAALAQERIPNISIIVVSGEACPTLAPEMVFLPKPVAMWELRDLLRTRTSPKADVGLRKHEPLSGKKT